MASSPGIHWAGAPLLLTEGGLNLAFTPLASADPAGVRQRPSSHHLVPKVPHLGPWQHPARGRLTALFYGRAHIAGIEPGRQIRLRGTVDIGADGRPAMINPGYELLCLLGLRFGAGFDSLACLSGITRVAGC